MKNLLIGLFAMVFVPILGDGWTGRNVSYEKDILGYVHLNGKAESGLNASGELYFLPPGFQPEEDKIYLNGLVNNDLNPLVVLSTGEVRMNNTFLNAYYSVFFDGIIFKAKESPLLKKRWR